MLDEFAKNHGFKYGHTQVDRAPRFFIRCDHCDLFLKGQHLIGSVSSSDGNSGTCRTHRLEIKGRSLRWKHAVSQAALVETHMFGGTNVVFVLGIICTTIGEERCLRCMILKLAL